MLGALNRFQLSELALNTATNAPSARAHIVAMKDG
jgi:hypothetical protein